jgi:hypothetical protein
VAKKWVKVDLKPKSFDKSEVQFVRFLCNYAGFQASKDEDRIPYKVRGYGKDWVLVLKNGHPIYVPEFLTLPCRPAAPKKVYEEPWEGN